MFLLEANKPLFEHKPALLPTKNDLRTCQDGNYHLDITIMMVFLNILLLKTYHHRLQIVVCLENEIFKDIMHYSFSSFQGAKVRENKRVSAGSRTSCGGRAPLSDPGPSAGACGAASYWSGTPAAAWSSRTARQVRRAPGCSWSWPTSASAWPRSTTTGAASCLPPVTDSGLRRT